jgi:selenocysteine-specific elongation factor
VLTVAGTGTVVAGTVASGSFRPGDAIRLIPSGLEGRVRSAERHGQSVDLVRRGERAALGLSGLEASRVHRGEVVVSAETEWTPSLRLDVEVRLAPDAPLALKQGTRLRVALGTAEVLGRVRLCGTVQQGAVSAAQLVLEAPLVARGGDRFILRSYSPVTVVGGGTVIDPHPPAGRPDFPPGLDPGSAASRLRLVASRSAAGLRRDQAAIRAGLDPASVGPVALAEGLIVDGETVLDPGMLARVEALAMDLVQGFHSDQPASPGIPLETLRASLRKQAALAAVAIRRLQESGQVMVTSGVVSRVGFRPSVTSREGDLERLLAAVAARGLESWAVEELGRSAGVDDVVGLLKLAEREGRVAAVERGWFVARSALDGFARDLALIAARGPITPAAVREATGLSRKHLIPLLEWADREGLTIRSGEARIPGPRLARP